MKYLNKQKLFYLLIFLFFTMILFFSPISGDDWGNYLVGKTGIIHSFGNAIGMYFDWEGRFISRILINILTYHKYLWNIVNSILITLMVYYSVKIINPKNKKMISLIVFLSIILMNIYTFSQTVTWIAGNITYLFVICLLLFYLYYLIKDERRTLLINILLALLNLIMTMFVEHMSLILISGNILILISKYLKNKKIDKTILLFLVVSIIGTLSMLLSPGSMLRSEMENLTFNKLNILEKIIYNIPNFIYYTFIINPFMLILLIISNYSIIKKIIKNNFLKVSLLIYLLLIPILTIITYPMSFFLTTRLNILIDPSNILVILYWMLFLLISLFLYYLDSRKDQKQVGLFFFLLGIGANTFMLLSPTWGFRTSLFTYISINIALLFKIDKYFKENSLIIKLLSSLTILTVAFYLVLYLNVYKCQTNLEKSITKQVKENKQIIEIDKFPYFINCNINPEDDYHLAKFKEYYKIPSTTEIVLIPGRWKYLILYSK